MIDPGEIPQVGGDLEAVAAAGGRLRAQGEAVTDTGSDVHATWQRLSSVYDAPEAGQLLAATAPVQSQAAATGGQLEQAGAALVSYADEVRPIKAQLESLRASAGRFVSSVDGDDDWREDGGKVDEHNALMSGVSSAVAAWMEAQRRCANTINALHGGTQYVADDGDGTLEPDEYGYTAQTLDGAAASEQGVPWGRPAEEDLPWYEDAWNAAGSFGKGLVVDGLWGAVKDLGTLVNPWSDDFGAAWTGLGTFALALSPVGLVNQFTAVPGFERGELGQALVAAGKGMVAWDMWKTDPARALGLTIANIGTAVIGTKGAGAAVKGGTAGTAAGRLATLPRVADVRLAVAAQIARLPKIELPVLNPALAGGGAPGRFHFDVDDPRDAGRVHNQADPAPGGGGTTTPPRPVPPVGATDNGPGAWDSRARGGGSQASFDYQTQVAGVSPYPDGRLPEYVVDGVDFDGFRDGVLLEAKGPGYAHLLEQKFAPGVENKLINQALSQARAADGAPVRWVFAEADAAAVARELFEEAGIGDLIEVVVLPPAR